MAPAATIHQFCVPDPDGQFNQCTGDWLALKNEQLAPLGVIADNNSWGWILGWREDDPPVWHGHEEYYGAYDLVYTAPLDEISNEHGILFVHSAGNDGTPPASLRFDQWQRHLHVDEEDNDIVGQTFCVSRDASGSDCPSVACNAGCEKTPHHPPMPFDTMGATASAKNVIAVGAVNSNRAIASFSSHGPAKDGRVKPEVVAPGTYILSIEPADRYGTSSGTSMAAPAVTGIAALLTEQWRRSHAGANPSPRAQSAAHRGRRGPSAIPVLTTRSDSAS
jgi:subtilisin family serine protease